MDGGDALMCGVAAAILAALLLVLGESLCVLIDELRQARELAAGWPV